MLLLSLSKTASLFAILSTGFLFFSCSHSTVAKKPTATTAKQSGVSLNKLKQGYGVYQKQCYQCHAQPKYTDLSVQQWNAIVPKMAQHAGISEQKGEAVIKYILAMKQQNGL